MIVNFKTIGDLREYFGKEPQAIELAEGSTLIALLDCISDRWGNNLPPYLWDKEKKRFRGPTLIVINKKVVQDMTTPLQDGMDIQIFRAISGG